MNVRRRDFITLLGGAAAWPAAAHAQQAERVRRVGFLSYTNEINQLIRLQTLLFDPLANLGWVEGRNLRLGCAAPLASTNSGNTRRSW